MRSILAFLVALIAVTSWAPPALAGKKKKKKFDVWRVRIVFIAGTDAWDEDRKAVEKFIDEQVRVAEGVFRDKPRLKIDYTIQRKTKLGDQPTNYPTFDSNKKFKKWMDKYVDNVAKSKTDGHITVLVVDEFCIKLKKKQRRKQHRSYKCAGGKAWFPHWVTPFSRKTGIAIRYRNDKHTLAHELGHIFGLRHTFEAYVNADKKLNCNKSYKPKSLDKGKCRSCKGKRSGSGDSATCDGEANVMDYCFTDSQYLNSCQVRRAANQRRKYMTNKGKVNYRDLRGMH